MDIDFILKAVGVISAAIVGGILLNNKFRLDSLLTNKKTNDKVNNNVKEDIKNQAGLEIEEAKRAELAKETPKDLSAEELVKWLNSRK